MPKKDIKGMLGNKSPSALRQGVPQIDILKEAAAALTTPSEKESDKVDQESSAVKENDVSDVKEEAIKQNVEVEEKIASGRKRLSQRKGATEEELKGSLFDILGGHAFFECDHVLYYPVDQRDTVQSRENRYQHGSRCCASASSHFAKSSSEE